MELTVLSSEEVCFESIDALGLSTTDFSFDSVEVLAAILRRAASLLCPCPANTLIHSVLEPSRGLVSDHEALRKKVEDTLDILVSHGDLLELSRSDEDEPIGSQVLLFLAPSAFVSRQSGAVILLGGLADNVSLLPMELESQIRYTKHVRVLSPTALTEGTDHLKELGYIEIPTAGWLKMPRDEPACKHLSRINRLLDAASYAGEVQGLRILDSEITTQYYRDRWVTPKNHTGRYIARRPQAYGADIWCYVQLRSGSPVRMIDLPVRISSWRGCDEAWRIQAAIDYENGNPQVFKLQANEGITNTIEFFSPVPMWVTRRLEVIGEPVDKPGCLFSYVIGVDEIAEEVRFLRDYAWLAEAS